jgi:cytochrome oxidase Cu insertion factor (SCO1/SenC/PrrC family)
MMDTGSQGQKPRSNLSLWLMVALVVAPVAASYLLYFAWPVMHSTNYGELLPPRPLPDTPLTLLDGKPFNLSSLKGKWVLAVVDSGACDARCEAKLVYIRQLRLTQGKEMGRVERAWLVTDGVTPRAELIEAYSGTWVIRAADAQLLGQFPAPRAPADHIYVIDPLGNLMMRYPPDPDPKRMIRDLSRLLKASRIG